jgi:signal transduction histidine kinase
MEAFNEFIETEEFDREYTLRDLLPLPLLADLLGEGHRNICASVLDADANLYFGRQPDGGALRNLIHSHEHQVTEPLAFDLDATQGFVFGLRHELETIGFLVMATLSAHIGKAEVERLGRMTARAVNRIIHLNCQHRMTASLHGQVVTESYRSLKKKADQLAQSEEKYRLLAENLEVEVARKTKEIRDTQVFLLQQEKLASIGQLAAGMAHEINNPVGFVVSNLNTLKTNADDLCTLIGHYQQLTDLLAAMPTGSKTFRQIREKIAGIDRVRDVIDIDFVLGDLNNLISESLQGAKRVKEIVQSLQDFTHPSVEKAESADINQCLDTTLAVLSSQLKAHIAIQRDYTLLPTLKCHVRDINQAFFNILKNAIQAVEEEGQITIHTSQADDEVIVSITDSGIGIDTSLLGRLFDPFFTTREVGAGAGLGLTQAYNTIRSHGGEISVKSVVGKGSSFIVKLPISLRPSD